MVVRGRVNHAIRGVVVPAETHTIEMHYAPVSQRWAFLLCSGGLLALLLWSGLAAARLHSGAAASAIAVTA